MEDAKPQEETSAEVTEETPDGRPAGESEGIAAENALEPVPDDPVHEQAFYLDGTPVEETEFLPYTPGDELPTDVKDVLDQKRSRDSVDDVSGGAADERTSDERAADEERIQEEETSAGDGDPATDEPAGGLGEIRSIFLGHAESDLSAAAAGMDSRLESTRREIVDEVLAVEGRLREEIKSSFAEFLSEVEHRALLTSESSGDSDARIDELLNLVSLTHGRLREELEKHSRDTKSALDDVLSLVRELARTIAIMIGGDDEEPRIVERTAVSDEAALSEAIAREAVRGAEQPRVEDASGEERP